MVSYHILQGEEFRRVARELRIVDKTLPAKFRKKMRDVAKPLIDTAKAKVIALPVVGRESTGLRRRVARGVRLSLPRNTSSVRITTSMTNPEEAALPRGLDTLKGWRHPVFGDREKWVQQHGFSWFRETMVDGREPLQHGLTEVLEEARDQIDRAGS